MACGISICPTPRSRTLGEEITLTEAAYARARTALTARQCFAGARHNHRKSGSRCRRRAKASAREHHGLVRDRGLKHRSRNLWVCASSFNARALRFYERHGFARAATLPGLVADGYDEILLRKFPLGPGRNAQALLGALFRRRRVGIDVGDVLHVGVWRMIDETTHRPRSRQSRRPSIRTHRHSGA